MLREMSEETFEKFVKTKKVVCVLFTSKKDLGSKIVEASLEEEILPKIQSMKNIELVKIDIDKNPRMQAFLDIRGGTTIIVFVDGQWSEFETQKGTLDRLDGKFEITKKLLLHLLEEFK